MGVCMSGCVLIAFTIVCPNVGGYKNSNCGTVCSGSVQVPINSICPCYHVNLYIVNNTFSC